LNENSTEQRVISLLLKSQKASTLNFLVTFHPD
jgi:hypothetical protein